MRNCNEIRRLANELEIEYNGDLCELYAHVSNRIAGRADPDEVLLALKREIEHQITLEHMDEYLWEQDEMGVWRYVDGAEFSARFWAARVRDQKGL